MDDGHGNRLHETMEHGAAVRTSRNLSHRFVFHLVVPNKRRDCVLGEVLPNGVLRLPRTEMPRGFKYPEPNSEHDVETQIEAQLGISGYVVADLPNGQNKRVQVADGVEQHEIVLVDTLKEDFVVRNPLEWIQRDVAFKNNWALTNEDGEDCRLNSQLEELFQEINGETAINHDERWTMLGWFEKLILWIGDVLDARNMVMEGRLRQRHRSRYSSVTTCQVKKTETQLRIEEQLREQDSAETVFVKAAIPLSQEAKRTATIGAVLGNIVPEVIATDEREGLLMQRNGGSVTDEVFDQECLIDTVLKMQELSMNRIKELEAGGVKVVDYEWLERNIESILVHKLLEDYRELVDDEEVAQVRSCGETIKKGCRRMVNLGLPKTLVHGDLYLQHVGKRCADGKQYQIFGWGKSFIGNPLHDFDTLLTNSSFEFPEISIDYENGVRQVCQRWLPTASVEDVALLFEVVRMLSGVIQIYCLTKEYDAYDESFAGGRSRVLGLLSDVFSVIEIMDSLDLEEHS